jgi:hypothetical protein
MKPPIISIPHLLRSIGFALLVTSWASAFGGTPLSDGKEVEAPKEAAPPEEDPWQFTLALPGWLANTSGTIGVGNVKSDVYMGVDTLLRHLDMIASVSAEARYRRWGVYGDMLYVKASDAVYPDGLIGKADVRLDQWIANLEVNYRVLEGPKGYLDLRAGVRYTDLYNKLALSGNNSAINQAATDLVNDAAERVKDQLSELNLKSRLKTVLINRLKAKILDRLSEAQANHPVLAIAPIAGGRLSGADALRASRDGVSPGTGDGGAVAAELDAAVQRAVGGKINELSAALQSNAAAAAQIQQLQSAVALAPALKAQALRDAQTLQALAQARIDSLKRQIAARIANVIKDKLNATASLNERWLDPYAGFAFRYNLSKAWYLTGKADIGGFGIGSEITWQAYGALGCQVTRYIFIEAGYRYLYTDYNHGGFLYDVTQSGAQVTAGVLF